MAQGIHERLKNIGEDVSKKSRLKLSISEIIFTTYDKYGYHFRFMNIMKKFSAIFFTLSIRKNTKIM